MGTLIGISHDVLKERVLVKNIFKVSKIGGENYLQASKAKRVL